MGRCCIYALSILATSTFVLAEEPTKPLLEFNGKDLSGFYVFVDGQRDDPDKVFSVTPRGWLRISGQRHGYLSTDKPLERYRMVAEYKWGTADPKADSGIFFNAVPEDKLWSKSLEFQMRSGATGDLCLIGGGSLSARGKDWKKGCIPRRGKGQAANEVENPKQEWNTVEIISNAGHVKMSINGKLLVEGEHASPSSGRVFFQCYNGELIYRKIAFLPLK